MIDDKVARAIAAVVVFGVALLMGGCANDARKRADAEAIFWDKVPERTWAQIEDLPAGTPVIAVVGIDMPNDWTGLAMYSLQHEESYQDTTCTGSGEDRRCTTTSKHRWVTDQTFFPRTIQTRLASDQSARIEIMPGYSPSGAWQYVHIHTDWGQSDRRAQGWGYGTALLAVGVTGKEPGQIDVSAGGLLTTDASIEDWRKSYRGRGAVWTGMMVLIGIAATAIIGFLALGDAL